MGKKTRPVLPFDRPWFKVFASEVLSDDKTSAYGLVELGASLLLWSLIWNTKSMRLPYRSAKSILTQKLSDLADESDPADDVLDVLTSPDVGIFQLKEGWLSSRRLTEQCEEITKKILQNRESGARGGRPPGKDKKPNGLADGKPDGKPNGEPNLNQNQNQNQNQIIKEKKKPIVRPRTYPEWFETFWISYPNIRRVKKKTCFEKLDRHRKRGLEIEDLMAGLERWKKSDFWIKDNGRYVHSPEVWINGEMWTEYPPTSKDIEKETADAREKRIFGNDG